MRSPRSRRTLNASVGLRPPPSLITKALSLNSCSTLNTMQVLAVSRHSISRISKDSFVPSANDSVVHHCAMSSDTCEPSFDSWRRPDRPQQASTHKSTHLGYFVTSDFHARCHGKPFEPFWKAL